MELRGAGETKELWGTTAIEVRRAAGTDTRAGAGSEERRDTTGFDAGSSSEGTGIARRWGGARRDILRVVGAEFCLTAAAMELRDSGEAEENLGATAMEARRGAGIVARARTGSEVQRGTTVFGAVASETRERGLAVAQERRGPFLDASVTLDSIELATAGIEYLLVGTTRGFTIACGRGLLMSEGRAARLALLGAMAKDI